MQARWVDEPSLLALPHLDESCLQALQQVANITVLPQLMELVQSSTGAGGGSAGGSKGGQAGLGAVSDALAQMLGAAKARDVLAVSGGLWEVDDLVHGQGYRVQQTGAGSGGGLVAEAQPT
jgi:hypothetical protein